MNLTDHQIQMLRSLVRGRLDGAKLYTTFDELAERMGLESGAIRPADIEALSAWFAESALPDIATTVIPPDNAESLHMLPLPSIVEHLGGEAAAQAEAARVRDFDWAHWAAS
ncbi:MAG TPA: hypothetical protein PLL33_10560 [Paracoccus sp. (in: a-proteobacteria)]|nr:hypothetical protein [Paracoccus sp. (in: a-proteobacteria)]